MEKLEAAENPPVGEVSTTDRAYRLAIDIKIKKMTVESRLDAVKTSAEKLYGYEATPEQIDKN